MEWLNKPYTKDGQKRTRKRFLIFPRCIKNKWKWLEVATFEEKWNLDYEGGGYWSGIKWIEEIEVCSECAGTGICPKCKGAMTATWIDKIKGGAKNEER